MDAKALTFEIIPSPHDPKVGASVGVRVCYGSMQITTESTHEKTQYANKVVAIEKLKLRLMKKGFLDGDSNDVIERSAHIKTYD